MQSIITTGAGAWTLLAGIGTARTRGTQPVVRDVGDAVGGTVRVRKQYHFWPGESGLDAWDVDRLIALSASFEVEEIDLSSVWEVDAVYWFDERDKPTVRKVIEHARLIQNVDLAHPIIVGPDGRVMDGMHRVAHAVLEGAATIRVVRFDVIPIPIFGTADQTTFRITSDREPAFGGTRNSRQGRAF
jgi:hypothetical protein